MEYLIYANYVKQALHLLFETALYQIAFHAEKGTFRAGRKRQTVIMVKY